MNNPVIHVVYVESPDINTFSAYTTGSFALTRVYLDRSLYQFIYVYVQAFTTRPFSPCLLRVHLPSNWAVEWNAISVATLINLCAKNEYIRAQLMARTCTDDDKLQKALAQQQYISAHDL